MITGYLISMMSRSLVSAALAFAALAGRAAIRRKKSGEGINWARMAALAVFTGFVVWLFSDTLGLRSALAGGFGIDNAEHNYVPFRQIARLLKSLGLEHTRVNLWGNILCFVPLGFAPPLFWHFKRPLWGGTLAALATSVFIELFQLFSPRQTDIDDVILNTLGGLAGAAVYLLFRRFCPRADSAVKRAEPGLRQDRAD